MAAVGAWLVPWAPYGRRGGVAGPLASVWRIAVGAWPIPWAPSGRLGGVGDPLGPLCQPWRRGRTR